MVVNEEWDEGLGYYTLSMLVVMFLFITFKLCIRRGILRRPVLRSKAIKTIIEFCQAYTVTIILVLGSLYIKDFYGSRFVLDSAFEAILFWILLVYQFWHLLVATIYFLLIAKAALKCDFSRTRQVFTNLRMR